MGTNPIDELRRDEDRAHPPTLDKPVLRRCLLPDTPVVGLRRRTLGAPRTRVERRCGTKLGFVVLFYEILLVLCTVLIAWFALYAVYRLISEDS